MDSVKIVFIGAVVIPTIVTIAVMLYTRHAAKQVRKASEQVKELKKNVASEKKLINTLERVISRQDQVLEEYRKEEV